MFLILVTALASDSQGQSLRDARRISPAPSTKKQAPAPPPSPSAEEIPVSDDLESWITKLVVEQIPHEYASKKKWGGTKRVMSGLDWEVDGIKVETRRQWKEVNHGNWSQYHVKLIDPEKEFRIELENVHRNEEGAAEFDLIVRAKLDCFGRYARWQRGVQLLNVSTEADATAHLKTHVVMKISFAGNSFPPDLVLDPRVTSAELKLDDLKLRRVSHADGPVVKSMSGIVEEGVEELLQEQEEKLVDKMNAQIKKKPERLRIPLSKLTNSKWAKWFGEWVKHP